MKHYWVWKDFREELPDFAPVQCLTHEVQAHTEARAGFTLWSEGLRKMQPYVSLNEYIHPRARSDPEQDVVFDVVVFNATPRTVLLCKHNYTYGFHQGTEEPDI